MNLMFLTQKYSFSSHFDQIKVSQIFSQYQTGAGGGSYMNGDSSFKCCHGRAVMLNLKPSGLTLSSTLFPPLTSINQ